VALGISRSVPDEFRNSPKGPVTITGKKKTVRYLGIEAYDALAIAEQVDV